MQIFTNCTDCTQYCVATKRFSIAHLTSVEPTKAPHIHSCHEIYYSIAGGKRFFIKDTYYEINPGDLFLISCNENHHVALLDEKTHERYNIDIHPEFIQSVSTENTNLNACFSSNPESGHRIHLDESHQKKLNHLIHKMEAANGFAADVIENALMSELLAMINYEYISQNTFISAPRPTTSLSPLILEVIRYINSHISDDLSIKDIAEHFYVSESYLCRAFKAQANTTINKYISGRRISIAKTLLDSGVSASDAAIQTGFSNYSTFYKTFTTTMGISPQSYLRYK